MKVTLLLVLAFICANATLLDRPEKALLAQQKLTLQSKQTDSSFKVHREYAFQAWRYDEELGEIGYMYDNRTDSGSKRSVDTANGDSVSYYALPEDEIPDWVHGVWWEAHKWDLNLPSGQEIDGKVWYGWWNNESLVIQSYDSDWAIIDKFEFTEGQWLEQERNELRVGLVPEYIRELVSNAKMGGDNGDEGNGEWDDKTGRL